MRRKIFFSMVIILAATLGLFSISTVKVASLEARTLKILTVNTDSFPYVTVLIQASDTGYPIEDLVKSELQLTEDTQKVDIVSFQRVSSVNGFALAIVYDYSASSKNSSNVKANKKGLKKFLNQFHPYKSRLNVVEFSDTGNIHRPITLEEYYWDMDSLIRLKNKRDTPTIYATIIDGVVRPESNPVATIFTVYKDGSNYFLSQESWEYSAYSEIYPRLSQFKMPLRIEGLGSFDSVSMAKIGLITWSKRFFLPPQTSDSLISLYSLIGCNAKGLYRVTYRSNNFSAADTFREIRLLFQLPNGGVLWSNSTISISEIFLGLNAWFRSFWQSHSTAIMFICLFFVVVSTYLTIYLRYRSRKMLGVDRSKAIRGFEHFEEADNEKEIQWSNPQTIVTENRGVGPQKRSGWERMYSWLSRIDVRLKQPITGSDFPPIPTVLNYKIQTVYYGTNRLKGLPNTRDGTGLFGTEMDEMLHTGVCEVSIPEHKLGELKTTNLLTRLIHGEDPERYFTILSNKVLDPDGFSNKITDALKSATESDVLLFVHGFNVGFDACVKRAAQIGADLSSFKGVVSVFSWPSKGRLFFAYDSDKENASSSGTKLAEYISLLTANGKTRRIYIIAHSMGNVVLSGALNNMKIAGKYPNVVINQLILAAPDISQKVFKNEILPWMKGGARITLYSSTRDWALKLSSFKSGGNVRIGGGSNSLLLEDGLELVDASNAPTSFFEANHSYYGDSALIYDIHEVIKGIPPGGRILDERRIKIKGVDKIYWRIKET